MKNMMMQALACSLVFVNPRELLVEVALAGMTEKLVRLKAQHSLTVTNWLMPNAPHEARLLAHLPAVTVGAAGFVAKMSINHKRVIATDFFDGKAR
jgi:hypothetical protein